MTTTALRPGATSSAAALDRAADALDARRAADVALVVAAVEWAEANPAGPGLEASGWGDADLFGEGFLPLAGEGAPSVAEVAPVELGAALGWSSMAAQVLMGDGLEIKHRLPRLWSLVLERRVPVHLAREVASHTRPLAYDAARWADRLVTADPAPLDRVRIAALVREARLFHEPDLVVGEEEDDLTSRRVDLFPGRTPATTEVAMKLDTRDAEAFERAVSRTAEVLHALGDDDRLGVRRARAVGVLADPQRALDLLTHGTDPGSTRSGHAAVKAGAELWLHLTHATLHDLDTFAGPVDAGPVGTLSTDLVKTWLADTTVLVRPVLDLARCDAVDAHDPPKWMADVVRIRDPCCVFPGCRRRSRRCDLDHIEPYVPLARGGPPGQTNPLNLAPLCRRHHRAKTHGGWRYGRRGDGSYSWTSPTGRAYDVLPARPPHPPEGRAHTNHEG